MDGRIKKQVHLYMFRSHNISICNGPSCKSQPHSTNIKPKSSTEQIDQVNFSLAQNILLIKQCRSFQAYSVANEVAFSTHFLSTFGSHSTFKDFQIPSSSETSTLVNTCVDWKGTPETHLFKGGLPGIRKEEVKVEVEDGNVLQISGERNFEKEDKNDKWHHVERSSGKFTRRFRLPENAKMYQVKRSADDYCAKKGSEETRCEVY